MITNSHQKVFQRKKLISALITTRPRMKTTLSQKTKSVEQILLRPQRLKIAGKQKVKPKKPNRKRKSATFFYKNLVDITNVYCLYSQTKANSKNVFENFLSKSSNVWATFTFLRNGQHFRILEQPLRNSGPQALPPIPGCLLFSSYLFIPVGPKYCYFPIPYYPPFIIPSYPLLSSYPIPLL